MDLLIKVILLIFCSYQEAIEDITKRMGAGMAKFICKEVFCNKLSVYVYIS